MAINLSEENRTKLDGIVQQMIGNNEADDDIKWVVNDFKQKYIGTQPETADVGYEDDTFDAGADLAGVEIEESGLGSRLAERVGKIIPDSPSDFAESVAFPFRTGIRTAGQLVGGVGDIIGEGISSIYKNIVPETTQDFIKSSLTSALETDVGQAGLEALRSGVDSYQEFKTNNPEVAIDIESALNVATAMPIGMGGKIVGKEAFHIAGDIKDVVIRKSIQNLDNSLKFEVRKRMPAIVKKGKMKGAIKDFDAKSQTLVENVIANKNNITYVDEVGDVVRKGGIPENTHEGLQAITQTKQEIFYSYDRLKKMSEQRGAEISTKSIVSGLKQLQNKSFIKRKSSIYNEIQRDIDFFENKKTMTLSEVQEEIANINAKSAAFYKNPNPNLLSNQAVEAVIADRMRKGMDDVIFSATGGQYAELKNAYAAIRQLEDGFVDAVKRNRVKAPGTPLDLSDVLTGGTAIYAWSNMNAGLIAAVTGSKLLKSWHTWRIGSDKLVRNMFSKADKIITKRNNLGFNPKSKLGQELKSRITGASRNQRVGIQEEQLSSVRDISIGRGGTPTPVSPIQKTRATALGKGQKVKSKEILTGTPFIDEKISIALSTPPALRDAEQKYIIDLIIRR